MKRMMIEKTEFKHEAKAERTDRKVPYEAPRAEFVSVVPTERIMDCGIIGACGINEFYQ